VAFVPTTLPKSNEIGRGKDFLLIKKVEKTWIYLVEKKKLSNFVRFLVCNRNK
jgi:hypothetical protein